MENYEEKLREIINSNSEYYPSEDKAVFAKYFPELKEKESEDEKTQKELIAFLEENLYLGYSDETWDSKGLKRWIAWVEKQGSQNSVPIDKVVKFLNEQLINDKDETTGEPFINFQNYGAFKEGFISFFKRKMLEKQGEKKSADEVLKIRQELYQSGYNDGYKHGQKDIVISLGKESIEALEHFVKGIGESGYASPYDNRTKSVYTLLEQLKQIVK